VIKGGPDKFTSYAKTGEREDKKNRAQMWRNLLNMRSKNTWKQSSQFSFIQIKYEYSRVKLNVKANFYNPS